MSQRRRHLMTTSALVLATVVVLAVPARAAGGAVIELSVDASEAPRKILHAHLAIPAKPGPLTLCYPRWVRGEHGPNGPIADLAGLEFSSGGKRLAWRRDDVDLFAFHLQVPAGADTVEVALDLLLPVTGGRFTSGVSSTAELLILNWYQLVLYPQHVASDDLTYAARLHLPAAWMFATALPVERQSADAVDFAPASLTTLADSPVLAGAHMRKVPLAIVDGAIHELDIAAGDEAALAIRPETVEACKRMVAEFHALFGGHHYRSYHWLLALTDRIHRAGIEHHESSDDRFPERTLSDPNLLELLPGLLAHEYAHSWNGKFRRPDGLSGADFEEPMKGDLLWVYEGLTTYLGTIMPVRSGATTPQQLREHLAEVAEAMGHQAGRSWRPLEDTAIAAQVLYPSGEAWRAWRRGTDFYAESMLIWLEADAIIREQTAGRRSLDDFCRVFFGGPDTPPRLEPYALADLLTALGDVARYDWRGFFEARVMAISATAPLGGITGGGWRLVETAAPNEWQRLEETAWKVVDEGASIGVKLDAKGVIEDVIPGMPAARAGLGPGMKIVAVNGREYSTDRLRDAINASAGAGGHLGLLAENDGTLATYHLNYHGGARYPHLERDPARPDLLAAILKPRAEAGSDASTAR